MKITSYLARFAALAFAGVAVGVVLDAGAIALFSIAAGAVVLVSAFGDYSPLPKEPRVIAAVEARRREHIPLAA